jgi:hypothetical protein
MENLLKVIGFIAIVLVLAYLASHAGIFGSPPTPVPQVYSNPPAVNSGSQPDAQSVFVENPSVPVNDQSINAEVEAQKALMTQYANQPVQQVANTSTTAPIPSYFDVNVCTNTVAFQNPVADNAQTMAILPIGTIVHVASVTSDLAWAQVWFGGDIYGYVPAEHLNVEGSSCAVR